MASWLSGSLNRFPVLKSGSVMRSAQCESGEGSDEERVGNPICESCEEDRKASDKNSKILENEPCFVEYQSVQKCMKKTASTMSRCMDVWRTYTECRRKTRSAQLGITIAPHPTEQKRLARQRMKERRQSK